jgi:penicillin G amidase
MSLTKTLWWLLLALIAVAVLAAAAGAVYVVRASPAHEGTLRVAGLKAEVSIARDVNGIPTIRAASIEDAAHALGVVHAQDRLWQLQTHLRIANGRMAEAFGPAALDNDKFLRALGVKRAAAAQWAAMKNAESRRVLEAYAAGINSVIDKHTAARPPELLVLGVPAEKWTPEDSLAWAIMMAWDLGGNWSAELLRLRLSLTLPVERVNEAMPPYPGEKPLATADYAALFRELKLGGAAASKRSIFHARRRRTCGRCRQDGRCGLDGPLAGRGAAVGRGRCGFEQLGGGRQPHHHRQAALGQ